MRFLNSVNLVHNQQGNSDAQSPSTRENSDHAKGVRQERTHEQQQSGKKVCYNCGDNYYAGHLSECRAKGKSCFACGEQNHFASMCHSSRGRNTSSKLPEKKASSTSDRLLIRQRSQSPRTRIRMYSLCPHQ